MVAERTETDSNVDNSCQKGIRNAEMQSFANFRQRMHDLLNTSSSTIDRATIFKELEEEAFTLCLSFDNQIRSHDNQIRSLYENLLSKDAELLRSMEQRLDLDHKLNTTKESASTLIRCLNISLKSSCHVIARTIIEMITNDQFRKISQATELLMERFRQERNYPVSRLIMT